MPVALRAELDDAAAVHAVGRSAARRAPRRDRAARLRAAISAAWPDLRAASSASTKVLRQSRSRSRSLRVATSRQSPSSSAGSCPRAACTTSQPAQQERASEQEASAWRQPQAAVQPPSMLRFAPVIDRGLVAAQEQRQRRDLLGRDEALGRLGGEQHVVHHLLAGQAARLHRVGDLVLDQRRPDIAGRDAIDGDAVARRLQRDRLGEAGDAVLGGDIGRLVGARRRGCARDAVLMIRPQPLACIAGSARRVVWNAAVRLIAMIASHFSGGKFSTGATCWMPALLTRMSGGPSSSAQRVIIASIAAGSRQVGAVVDRARAPRTSRSISAASPKPLIISLAPSAASARAIARPMPEVDPVTSATLPSKIMQSPCRNADAPGGGDLQPWPVLAHWDAQQEDERMRLGGEGPKAAISRIAPARAAAAASAAAAATCSAVCCRWCSAASGSSASSSCCSAIAR